MKSSEIEWYSRKEKDQKNPITVFITEIENGVFLVLSDKGARIGTIAIGIPTPLVKNRINISSMPIVFGIRNDLLTRAIAERISHQCQKIVIASTYLSDESPELAQRSLRFAEKVINKYFSQKQKSVNKK